MAAQPVVQQCDSFAVMLGTASDVIQESGGPFTVWEEMASLFKRWAFPQREQAGITNIIVPVVCRRTSVNRKAHGKSVDPRSTRHRLRSLLFRDARSKAQSLLWMCRLRAGQGLDGEGAHTETL